MDKKTQAALDLLATMSEKEMSAFMADLKKECKRSAKKNGMGDNPFVNGDIFRG